jgi:DNA polymerase-3 subunit epsilon
MARISALGLPVHPHGWLGAPDSEANDVPAEDGATTDVLPRGGVIDLPALPASGQWHVGASWAQQTACEIDVVAFVLDEDEQVSCDGDFVFHSAPESPDGATRLLCDGPTEQTIAVDLAALPPQPTGSRSPPPSTARPPSATSERSS